MGDEQVVPDFGMAPADQVVPGSRLPQAAPHPAGSRKRKAEPDAADAAAPPTSTTTTERHAKRCLLTPPPAALRPEVPSTADLKDGEIRVRPRWETPRRRGVWREPWQSANELTPPVAGSGLRKAICGRVRSVVSRAVVLNVGLPFVTVEKWLYLLAEYLELNADEHVLAVCLIRKYLKAGRSLVGENDWARPQRWECVVAISCYLSVLLSEEFPGRTAYDLKELLGSNFKFGLEQVEFLKAIDWKSNVSAEEFQSAMDVLSCQFGADEKLIEWFGLESTAKEAGSPLTQPQASPAVGKVLDKAQAPHIAQIPQVVMPFYRQPVHDVAHTVPTMVLHY